MRNSYFKMIIDNSGATICKILTMCTNPANFPVLIHCTHGKDRTGLTVALLLACVGVEEQDIIADYVASEALGGTELARPDIEVRIRAIL